MKTNLTLRTTVLAFIVIFFALSGNAALRGSEILRDGNKCGILNYGHLFDFDFTTDGKYMAALTGAGFVLLDMETKQVVYNILDFDLKNFVLSADDSEVAFGCASGAIKFYETSTGKLLKELQTNDSSKGINYFRLSPDKKKAIVQFNQFPDSLRTFELETGEWKAIDLADEICNSFPFELNSDGATLTLKMLKLSDSASPEYYFNFYNLNTGKSQKSLQVFQKEIRCYRLSPDGKKIACAIYEDSSLYILDAANGALENKFTDTNGAIAQVNWNPDGKLIAYHLIKKDNYILRIVDLDSIEKSIYFTKDKYGQSEWLNSKSLGYENTDRISLLNTGTGVKFDSLTGFEYARFCIDWNPRRPYLLTNSESLSGYSTSSIYVWNSDSLKKIDKIRFYTGSLTEMAWSPDGSKFAYSMSIYSKNEKKKNSPMGGGGASLTVVDSNFKEINYINDYNMKIMYARTLDWNPASSKITYAGGYSLFEEGDKYYISLSNDEQSEPYFSFFAGNVEMYDISWSHDGSKIAGRGASGLFGIWNANNGDCIRKYQINPSLDKSFLNTIDWNYDGNFLYYIYSSDTVIIENAETGTIVKRLTAGSNVKSIRTSFDGTKLACGLENGFIKVYDIQNWRLLNDFRAHSYNVESLSFSGNSNILASCGGGGCIRIWDLATTGVDVAESAPTEAEPQIRIAPNPANDRVRILVKMPASDFLNCSIVDVLGRNVAGVFSGSLESGGYSFEADVSELSAGCYMVVSSSGKFLRAESLVIER